VRQASFFFADDLDRISFTACSLNANLEETQVPTHPNDGKQGRQQR